METPKDLVEQLMKPLEDSWDGEYAVAEEHGYRVSMRRCVAPECPEQQVRWYIVLPEQRRLLPDGTDSELSLLVASGEVPAPTPFAARLAILIAAFAAGAHAALQEE